MAFKKINLKNSSKYRSNKQLNKFQTQKNVIADQNYIGRAKNSPKSPILCCFSANSPWGVNEIELTPLGSYARDYGNFSIV
jgi:hypothetical protein